MLASRATGHASGSVRPRVLLHLDRDAPWASSLASRADVEVKRATTTTSIEPDGIDVVVCSMESLAAVRALRDAGSRLPVIVVLGADAAEDVSRAFAAGATDVARDDVDLAEAFGVFAGLGESGQRRHRVRLAVTIERDSKRESASIEALSLTEAQLRTSGARLEPGDVLSVELPLARESAPLVLRAVVRGSAPGVDSTIARLRFVGVSDSEHASLSRWLGGLDRETRSTDPADAFVALRRFDRSAAGAALTSADAPEWIAQAVQLLSKEERAALAAKEESPASLLAFARLRAEALAYVLERFDPALDGEPAGSRDTVLEVIDGLVEADASRGKREMTEDDPIARAAIRLKRAVAARLPHLAAAYDAVLGRSNALHVMDLAERAGSRAFARRTKHRVLAAIAGAVLGGAVVYSVIATLSGAP